MHQDIRNLFTKDQAHAGFERVIAGVDMARINEAHGHSLWQLLEHIRIDQLDLLEHMTDPDYGRTGPREFPRDYWPAGAGNASSWERSIQQFRADHAKVLALVEGDLLRSTPSAPEHTILRDLLVLADHTAYHLGQMTLVRKLMGNW